MSIILKRFLSVSFFITIISLSFLGCATTPKDEEEGDKVSTLPWNTPQKWEKSAPLGGAASY